MISEKGFNIHEHTMSADVVNKWFEIHLRDIIKKPINEVTEKDLLFEIAAWLNIMNANIFCIATMMAANHQDEGLRKFAEEVLGPMLGLWPHKPGKDE